MEEDSICYLSIGEAADRFRSGTLTSSKLTEALLSRIERLNPTLNAYLRVTPDLALRQARSADEALTKGGVEERALLGIPIGLKDLYDVADVPTTAGSPIRPLEPAAEDCAVAASLRAAGAVFLGKHHLHEWALGVTNVNPHFGPCRNPWSLKHVPGGSSGGTGVSIAAGLCLGGFGSDTGGSIRIPASLCGVTGLKPTTGRVSLRGVVPLSWSLDHAGPLARTVEDAATLLKAVDRYDPSDPYCVDGPREDPTSRLGAGLGGMRVLVVETYFMESADTRVSAAVEAGTKALENGGAKVQTIKLPGVDVTWPSNLTIILADAATYHADDIAERADKVGADVLARLRRGVGESAREYAEARRVGAEWRRRFEKLLEGDVVLVVPTTPITAPPIEGTDALAAANRLTSFTGPFNLTGLPALSVPCGFASGLPIGMQIIGRPWAEALVARVGAAYQRLTDWHLRRPSL